MFWPNNSSVFSLPCLRCSLFDTQTILGELKIFHEEALTCDYIPEFLPPAQFLVSGFKMLVTMLRFRFCLDKIIMMDIQIVPVSHNTLLNEFDYTETPVSYLELIHTSAAMTSTAITVMKKRSLSFMMVVDPNPNRMVMGDALTGRWQTLFCKWVQAH